jgi:hypothetical protein
MTRTPAATPRSPPPAFVEPCIPTLADRRLAAKNGDEFAPPHDQPSRQEIAYHIVIRRCVVRHSKFGRPSGSGQQRLWRPLVRQVCSTSDS